MESKIVYTMVSDELYQEVIEVEKVTPRRIDIGIVGQEFEEGYYNKPEEQFYLNDYVSLTLEQAKQLVNVLNEFIKEEK